MARSGMLALVLCRVSTRESCITSNTMCVRRHLFSHLGTRGAKLHAARLAARSFSALRRRCASLDVPLRSWQHRARASGRAGNGRGTNIISEEFPRLQDLVELREQLHALAGRQPTELQQAVRLLERDTEVIKKKLSGGLLAALGADAAALAGAARQADLLEVVAAVEGKIGRGEVQALLRQAVAMALSAYRAAADAAAAEAAAAGQPGRALKSKCLSCDRDVEPWRPPPLGPLPSAAGLLPSVDKFRTLLRPSTAPQGPGLNAAELRRQQAGGAAAPPPPRSASPPPAKPGSGLQSGVVVTGGGERPPLARGDAARPGTAGGARPVFG